MPNVIELLNQDHREVEQLFAQFESTQDFDIALQICEELTAHAAVEEEIVYPVLERIDPEIEQEAEEEHAEAKELIARIQSMEPGDPELVPTVLKLKAGIQHHVEEEEGEAWPKMRSGAGEPPRRARNGRRGAEGRAARHGDVGGCAGLGADRGARHGDDVRVRIDDEGRALQARPGAGDPRTFEHEEGRVDPGAVALVARQAG